MSPTTAVEEKLTTVDTGAAPARAELATGAAADPSASGLAGP
jgi:hypothetical protein